MERLSTQSSKMRPSRDEWVFADDAGRLRRATRTAQAVLFTCIDDGRRAGRALAIDRTMPEEDIGDDTLRARRGAAPRIGTLS